VVNVAAINKTVALRDHPGSQAPLDRTGYPAMMALKDRLALLENPTSFGLRELAAGGALKEVEDRPDQQEVQANKVEQVEMVPLDHVGLQENLETQDPLDHLAPVAPMVNPVVEVQMEPQVLEVVKDQLAVKEIMVNLALLDRLVTQATRALTANQVAQVVTANKAPAVPMEIQAPQAKKDSPGLQDPMPNTVLARSEAANKAQFYSLNEEVEKVTATVAKTSVCKILSSFCFNRFFVSLVH